MLLRQLFTGFPANGNFRRKSSHTLIRDELMPVDLKDLLIRASKVEGARTPLLRLNFLQRVASEEELTEFFADLLVKAAQGKHSDQWNALGQLLEEWEDRTFSRLAANSTFPEVGKTPWTPLKKPVSQARIALITSGGLYLQDQTPFVTTNDPSYREIPRATTQKQIRVSHRGYDINGPLEDMNCLLPLSRFQELEEEGVVGALAETNYSFNGSVPDLTLLREWPYQVVNKLRQERVDAVLLIPA